VKKFRFSLETVLSYKNQVLEALQGEHAIALANVHAQQDVVDGLWQRYRTCNQEYRRRKEEGLSITDATLYQNGLRALEGDIQLETRHLEELERIAEEKRLQVVEAKKETSSLEKLREKKLDSYQKAVNKSEEQLIEEFVSSARANAIGA